MMVRTPNYFQRVFNPYNPIEKTFEDLEDGELDLEGANLRDA